MTNITDRQNKYLDLIISNDLTAGEHLKVINKKYNFLAYKLGPIRILFVSFT
jgi:hypothetical protein